MHHLFTTARPRASFYKLLVRVYADESWLARSESDMALLSAAEGFSAFGLAALDLVDDEAAAQRWFAESAGSDLAALRIAKNAFARDVWRCLARVGLCRDFATAKRLAVAYLKTPDAIPGQDGTGGPSPTPNDHFWHPTQALACFFAQSSDFGAALDELLTMPTPTCWNHSSEWWGGVRRLASECLGKDVPQPFELLKQQGEINQRMFEQWHKEDIYERWFGELTLAFASAAHAAGWGIPEEDPHPSLPLACLRLPRRKVVARKVANLPRLDDDLRRAIERAFRETKTKKRKKKAKRSPRR